MLEILKLSSYELVAFIFIVIFMLVGFKRGLLKSVVAFLLTVLPLAVAIFLSPNLTEFIKNNTGIYDVLYTQIEKQITTKPEETGSLSSDNDSNDSSEDEENDPSIQTNIQINNLNLPKFVVKGLKMNNNETGYSLFKVKTFDQYAAAYLATTAVRAMAFILLFLLTYLIIAIIGMVFSIIAAVPVLRGFNRFFGALLGAFKAVILIWIFYILISIIYTRFGYFGNLVEGINNSGFLKLLYDNNLIYLLLT